MWIGEGPSSVTRLRTVRFHPWSVAAVDRLFVLAAPPVWELCEGLRETGWGCSKTRTPTTNYTASPRSCGVTSRLVPLPNVLALLVVGRLRFSIVLLRPLDTALSNGTG